MALEGSYRFVIVGAGFFGAVLAHRIATELGESVLVLERRPHIGGNSYSYSDAKTGIEIHQYGTHIFHTSNEEVWEFVNRFSKFNNYRHRVITRHQGKTFTMPINLATINSFFGVDLTPAEAEAFIRREVAREAIENPRNLEEKAISLIGRPLYDAFVKGYTAKQWETDPKDLPPHVITRLPVRYSFNDFYFSDLYEGLPLDGYAKIFERMLDHERIRVVTDCDFFLVRDRLPASALTIYTGPVDRYFDYRCGALSWRTLDFDVTTHPVGDFQGAAVINYPAPDVRFTRIHEFKHLHPERRPQSAEAVTMHEYSRSARRGDEPYYPVNTAADKAMYEGYKELVRAQDKTIFGGRLGTYRYLDMHQAIAAAFKVFENRIKPYCAGRPLEYSDCN